MQFRTERSTPHSGRIKIVRLKLPGTRTLRFLPSVMISELESGCRFSPRRSPLLSCRVFYSRQTPRWMLKVVVRTGVRGRKGTGRARTSRGGVRQGCDGNGPLIEPPHTEMVVSSGAVGHARVFQISRQSYPRAADAVPREAGDQVGGGDRTSQRCGSH